MGAMMILLLDRERITYVQHMCGTAWWWCHTTGTTGRYGTGGTTTMVVWYGSYPSHSTKRSFLIMWCYCGRYYSTIPGPPRTRGTRVNVMCAKCFTCANDFLAVLGILALC